MKVLKKKPLVEAIFELRWNLEEPAPGIKIDPHYKILVGIIYGKLNGEYQFHEQLPTASMPDEMAGYVVQHRFRKDQDKWPLVQIGPGIITVNDTEGYTWPDFKERVIQAVNALFETYPDSKTSLKLNRLLLRYIDAVAFDFEKDDVFAFLKKQMKTNIGLFPKLFEDTGVGEQPLGFDTKFTFASTKPKGAVYLRFVRGRRDESDVLIWETMVQADSEHVPKVQNEISTWIEDAHDLTHDWFFKIIEGELQKRFE